MKKRGGFNTKGQVTIFIIIALVVIGLAVSIYFLTKGITTKAEFDVKNPQAFIASCLDKEIKNNMQNISMQGGSLNPVHYFTYNDVNIEYLCYTNANYQLCVVQQPLLKQHIESEIAASIEDNVTACFDSLKQSYEDQGYTAQMQPAKTTSELLPKRVIIKPNYIVTVTKGETQRFTNFDIVLNNNLYELTSIAKSIIEWEATVGDADPRTYMNYYPDLKIEKKQESDGTKIYILTDRNTGNKFQFASRSLYSPPGF